jgi:Tol biopolymer transport system component
MLSATAAPAELLSVRNPLVEFPAGGNGNSTAPWVSADGRFVLFTSSANDLVTGDNGYLSLDVFLRDRASNVTTLVSSNLKGTGGGDDSSMFGSVSTNGRYVSFESAASDLVPGDTNGVRDVFVRDLLTATTRLVSVATNGGPGDAASSEAAMTPDGRYVAFLSLATNLVAGDTNRMMDVFVRDLLTETTRVVSVGANLPAGASMATPVITPDGRFVAFFSTALGLATGVPAATKGEIYLRDLVANSTTWVSTNASATASNFFKWNTPPSYHPALSDDGQFVAFKTGSTNGLTAPGNAPARAGTAIFHFDTATKILTLVSSNGFPPWVQNDDVFGPEMTPDGRFVVYGEKEPTGSITNASVRVWDAQTGSNFLASVNLGGGVSTNSLSHSPAMSSDGRYVAFMSDATNLVGNAISNGFHVYLRDLQSNTTLLVGADTNGVGSTDFEGATPSLSADGAFVVFSGLDGKLVAGDNNNALDVFLRNTLSGTTELISQRDPTVVPRSGNAVSMYSQLSLSEDGQRIAFVSHASDLIPNDSNKTMDVFVYDLTTASNRLVSIGMDGMSARSGWSANPAISGDGRFVAFVSTATNIAPLANNQRSQIFRHDLQTGSNILVTVNSIGTQAGTGASSLPRISQDGRYITYQTSAANLGGAAGVYRFDADLRTNVYLPSSVVGLAPSLSRDGRRVAYPLVSQQVRVRDLVNGTDVYTTSSAVSSATLSPEGTRLLYRFGNLLAAADLAGNSNLISFYSTNSIQSPAQWSRSERFFAFVTASNAVPADGNGLSDVYLYDLIGRTLTLISVDASLSSTGNGPSDSPAVSGDGRFVVFRSFATNLVPGISNSPNIFLHDRLAGSNTLLTVASGLPSWTSWASRPVVSANSRTAAFQSWSSGLITNDLNRAQDVLIAVVAAAQDSDGDGITDAWTQQYFGHPTGQASDFSRAEDDADGDGMTNLQEYTAGTNPLDPASLFRTTIVLVVATNRAELSWPAASDRGYRVQYKNDLSDPAWQDAPGTVSVSGNRGSYFAVPNLPRRYYRVSVLP